MRAQNVMDNLIYRREIPVMIGGLHQSRAAGPTSPSRRRRTGATATPTGRPNTTRSTTSTPRVIVDELMPALNKDYNISKDPERHGIGGASSGAIAAFTVAWERPDQFRKVLSIVGSFANLRGGHVYPGTRAAEREEADPHLPAGRPQRQPRHRAAGASTTRRATGSSRTCG